jgi:hypothetical protein
LEKQQDMLLPVPYYLLTFTLPDSLRAVSRSNQTRIYHLLFRTSAAAAQHLSRDPRFVGGQIGNVYAPLCCQGILAKVGLNCYNRIRISDELPENPVWVCA